MAALCSGVALMNASMAVASATATLVAADRLGAAWGGVPNTAGIVGTGAGALALTRFVRTSRRRAFALGYTAAAAGACLAALAVANGDVAGLCLGMLLLGLGNAGPSSRGTRRPTCTRRDGAASPSASWCGARRPVRSAGRCCSTRPARRPRTPASPRSPARSCWPS